MKVQEKIKMELKELVENGPITIVAFGDSVTHGAVGPGEIDYDTVYWNRLRQKMNKIRNYVPVNVINAGIGGYTAAGSLPRMDKQVLAHNPDLVIVCFGLNDVNGELNEYLDALRTIFSKVQASGSDLIFMTPNMMNTYVAEDTQEDYKEYAQVTAEIQNGGRMDLFMESAVALAKEMEVTVCDCYSQWKELAKTQDTTMLLANRINHPTREMHELFAESLFRTIFGVDTDMVAGNVSTMYQKD